MNTRTTHFTKDAPEPVGPYSQAVSAGGFVFCSGQIGLSPTTGELAEGGATAELQRALLNTEAVLTTAGLAKRDIVRVELFVTDLGKWEDINAAYTEFFTEEPFPARSTVEVAALPKGASIEVACIACERVTH